MPTKARKRTTASKAPIPDLKHMGVVIPTYKNRSTIGQTLESILSQPAAQSLGAIVVCEDGGEDGTYEVAARKLKGIANGKLISNSKNSGEAATMKSALAALPDSVTWVLVMHGDDYAKPGWIESLTQVITDAPSQVAIVCSSYDWLAGEITYFGENLRNQSEVKTFIGPDYICGMLLSGCWWHISGAALHRQTYLELNGRDPRLPHFGDWDLALRLFKRGGGITYIPRSLTVYRQNSKSVSHKSHEQMKDIAEKLIVLDRFQTHLSLIQSMSIQWRLLRSVARQAAKNLVKLNFRNFLRAPRIFLYVVGYSIKFLAVQLTKVVQ